MTISDSVTCVYFYKCINPAEVTAQNEYNKKIKSIRGTSVCSFLYLNAMLLFWDDNGKQQRKFRKICSEISLYWITDDL